MLSIYLAYPVVETIRLSLTERVTQPDGTTTYGFVGLANYSQMMAEPKFWEALSNNMMWLIFVPALSTAFSLLAAQLTDRIGWGSIAKSLIFMSMAISFVGAAVIWKLVYDARPPGTEQIGILNALYVWFSGNEPQQWLTVPFWNSFLLMIVLVWIQTGFAMVITARLMLRETSLYLSVSKIVRAFPVALICLISRKRSRYLCNLKTLLER